MVLSNDNAKGSEMKSKHWIFKGNEQYLDVIKAEIIQAYKDNPVNAKGMREDIVISMQNPDQYKTNKQNKFFHDLLDEYWISGQSSYEDAEKMRDKFKGVAGLIEEITIIKPLKASLQAKRAIFQCLSILLENKAISSIEYKEICRRLRGEQIQQKTGSWSDVKKKPATIAIDCLITEMKDSGVNSKKFNEILENNREFYN